MIIDLFAGPGGWSTGLNMIGRAETIGIEWDKAACDTARAAGHERLQADIAELDPLTVALEYGLTVAEAVEGIIGSPPCQGFSMAGNGKGREDSARLIAAVGDFLNGDPRETLRSSMSDDRSILALEPLRWVLALEPEWTTWEQVPAVLPLWEACAEVLRSAGYESEAGIVYAETLGVPQTRKRAILRARRGPLAPLRLTHSRYYSHNPAKLDDGVQKWVSMAEALGRGMTHRPSMTVTGGGASTGGAEPFGNAARQGMLREQEAGRWMVAAGVTGAGTPRPQDCPAPTLTGKGTAYWIDDLDAYGKPLWTPTPAIEGESAADITWPFDRPSPKIVGSYAPDVVAAPGYRKKGDPPRQKTPGSVRVSLAEAAALQSFRPGYPWQGLQGKQFQQVGNAVPPLMAAHILASVGAGVDFCVKALRGDAALEQQEPWSQLDLLGGESA